MQVQVQTPQENEVEQMYLRDSQSDKNPAGSEISTPSAKQY